MKTFRTVGSGSTQTIEPIENNKIPVYETKAAAEADIANLSDGQIIATKDEGNEYAKPVDVVESGNLHAVTSNAVANYIKNLFGTFTVTLEANGSTNQGIAFNEILPNKNYIIQYRTVSAGSIVFTEINRENTGASVNVRNLNNSQLTITCEWFLICKV